MHKINLLLRFGVRRFCCDGVGCESVLARRDGVIGVRPGVRAVESASGARFDGVFPFGCDIFDVFNLISC